MSRKPSILKLTLLACMVLALALASPARADDDNTIAGVLSANPGCNEYAFDSDGGQILFAEAGAELYQSKGRSSGGGCDHDDGTVHEEGGCSGDDGTTTTHDDGGCGDSTSGPSDLCLQVVDSLGGKICWAGRPARPGWQRDPRLACPIANAGEYSLRVFRGQCGSTAACDNAVTESGAPESSPTHYLLRVRLVDVGVSGGKLFLPPREK